MNRRIIRVNPLREMMAMQNALDRMFEGSNWQENLSSETELDAYPLPLDIIEDDKHYIVTTDLPGISDNQIEVRLDNEYLCIEAVVPDEEPERDVRMLLKERRFGKFSRRVHLAQPIDADKVEADLENGVLRLQLPKVPEVQPKQIAVKVKKN